MKTVKLIKTIILTAIITLSVSASQLSTITSWAYQLQNADIDKIVTNKTFDLIVMDYSLDGTDSAKYTLTEINKIKSSEKLPIAYISIGEAEDYRYYWKLEWNTTKPEWIGAENPDWKGNFEVKYWYDEWQNIVLDYVDTIISQGFSGIYLDIVEGFYYWQEEAPVADRNAGADTLMVKFIERIRAHIDSTTTTEFFIIPQNGASILDAQNINSIWKERYFSAINAIGVEDVFFYGENDENNLYNPDTYRINLLKQYTARNIPVFSIEYLTVDSLIERYKTEAGKEGFVPYCSVRNLEILTDGFKDSIVSISITNTHFNKNNVEVNLVNNRLHILSSQRVLKLKIFTPNGKIVGTTNESMIDVSNLSSSLYFVRVLLENKNNLFFRLILNE